MRVFAPSSAHFFLAGQDICFLPISIQCCMPKYFTQGALIKNIALKHQPQCIFILRCESPRKNVST